MGASGATGTTVGATAGAAGTGAAAGWATAAAELAGFTGAAELAGGAVHLPASQTRSPLQSVSLVHWARAQPFVKSSATTVANPTPNLQLSIKKHASGRSFRQQGNRGKPLI